MLDKQFSSLKISKSHLTGYLESSGYWGSEYLKKRNEFILSPCAYKINFNQLKSLNFFGRELYRSMELLSKKIYSLAIDVPRNREDQELMGILSHSSRKLLGPSEIVDCEIPPILKVDIVQDIFGNYQAVEVDTYNPRGLGYNALLDPVGNLGPEENKTFETMKPLAQMLKNFSPSGRVAYFISDYERYYEPSFVILQKAISFYGIELILIKENELNAEKIVSILNKVCNGFVFMIPESFQNITLRENLMQAYRNKELNFFFPPKAFLGSKMLLPFLANYDAVTSFFPKTMLVSKYHNSTSVLGDGEWLIKSGQSSGMKGVFFSDLDTDKFWGLIKEERTKKRPTYIIQKKVKQAGLMVETFGEEFFAKYYLRLIAQVTSGGVIGLEITGRKDCRVHGAPDCIMLPVILG